MAGLYNYPHDNCTNCGAQVTQEMKDDDETVCAQCGTQIAVGKPRPANAPYRAHPMGGGPGATAPATGTRNSRWGWALGGAAVAGLVGLMAYRGCAPGCAPVAPPAIVSATHVGTATASTPPPVATPVPAATADSKKEAEVRYCANPAWDGKDTDTRYIKGPDNKRFKHFSVECCEARARIMAGGDDDLKRANRAVCFEQLGMR